LDKAGYSWGSVVAPNGDVYVGSQPNGYLYRYRTNLNVMENVGKPIATESHLYRIAADEEGNIFGGTYPNGKLFRYDPVADTFTDFGQLAAGEKYVRSVAAGNGIIYAGTAVGKAQLFAIDPISKVKKRIALPDMFHYSKEVYDLTFVSGLLFARLTNPDFTSELNNVTLVYDTFTNTWIDRLMHTPGIDVSPAGPDGNVYLMQKGQLTAYNITTRTAKPTTMPVGSVVSRGFGILNLSVPSMPGESVVTISSRGEILAYNPCSGKWKRNIGNPLGSANALRSLTTGPDGNIYVGGYLSPSSITRFKVDSFQMEQLAGISQVEGMGVYQGKLYIGVYPGASIFQYDPLLPWDSQKRMNPLRLNIQLAANYQDRPFVFADAERYLAIGTVPIAGMLGGALVLYDPAAQSSDVFHQVVENESPVALTYKNGLLYGGTTVWGGVAADPVKQDGTLFIFDTHTKRKVFEMNPVPGERAVTSLAFDHEGMLWGLTKGTLFKFDPVIRRILKIKILYPYTWMETVLAGGYLHFYDGMLYGEAASHIFRLDPITWEHTTLTNGNYFAQDAYGRIFTIKNSTELYLYDDIPPKFGDGAALDIMWTKEGDLLLEWPVNPDMKSFRINRDETEVTATGILTRPTANGKAKFLIQRENAYSGIYCVTAIDYAGNSSNQLLSSFITVPDKGGEDL
jgi:streptogramin lyase